MKRKYELYLKDIITCINKIETYVEDYSFKQFCELDMVIDSVLHNLIIIGEAVSQMPEEFKKEHHNIPWREIKDFRNIVIHKYHTVDLEETWDIIKNELKPLKEKINDLLN